MTNTLQITISVNDSNIRDQLIAHLSEIDFDAFEETEDELIAFINQEKFNPQLLENILLKYNVEFADKVIAGQNWNEQWERSFEPVVLNDFCAIRAEFHKPFSSIEHEIIITPKMSFGTGHHETTYLMISAMSGINFIEKQVADFGTGTGVLAILAEKLGSAYVWAIDNDSWSIENSNENIGRNNCKNIEIEKMEGFYPRQKFDVVLANINKNIIMKNAGNLFLGLKSEGTLLLSGLLKQDENDIVSAFVQKGLKHISTREKNNWISILFTCI